MWLNCPRWLFSCLEQRSALTYLSCLDTFIALESKWAPDLANDSPAPGNLWQHKTQGLILRLCNETHNHKFQVGLRKPSATRLGHFRPLFPKQTLSGGEIWTRKPLLCRRVKYGLLQNVILQAQPLRTPLTHRRWAVSIRHGPSTWKCCILSLSVFCLFFF